MKDRIGIREMLLKFSQPTTPLTQRSRGGDAPDKPFFATFIGT
ncbi:MAG: hypothetical protein ACREDR_39210 [Blastocatellia bacterium]